MKLIKIENKAAKVKLDDQVDEWSRKQLMQEIAQTYGSANAGNVAKFGEITNVADNAIDTLDIEINSPGGSVYDGFLIHNEILALRARGVVVTATINPLAASMGSVIAMACDSCRIVPNGQMMIHEAAMYTGGNAADLARMSAVLESISCAISEIYASKTGMTPEECRAMMKDETWMDAKKCVALGFADAIFDIRKPGCKMESAVATNTQEAMSFLARLTNPSADESIAEIAALKAQISEIEGTHATELAAMKARVDEAEEALKEAAESEAEKAEIAKKLAETQAEKSEVEKKLSESEAETATAKASAAALAVEIAGAAGITKPLDIEGGNPGAVGDQKTMTREAFTALKPAVAMKFVKDGGKLTD